MELWRIYYVITKRLSTGGCVNSQAHGVIQVVKISIPQGVDVDYWTTFNIYLFIRSKEIFAKN